MKDGDWHSIEGLLQQAAIDPNDNVLLLGNGLDLSDWQQDRAGKVEIMQLSDVVADNTCLAGQRWPLVCVVDSGLEATPLTQLLAQIRDLHADRLLHIEQTAHWSLAQSLALGFSHLQSNGEFNLYEFDIRTYKIAPDWLNSRHWANPELWGKHRW